MADKQISRVTLSEIQQELGQDYKTSSSTLVELPEKSSYIAKLKDAEVSKFFEPFGFVSMNRHKADIKDKNDFDAIYVLCDNFEAGLTDYDIIVDVFENPESKNTFDFNAFLNYCDTIDVKPDKALADIIQVELLGQRFHSYAKRFADKKQKDRKQAFEALPKTMKNHLAIIDEKRKAEINSIKNKLTYGTFEGEPKTNI